MYWLVTKLGFQKTVQLFSAENMIPNSVPVKQRREFISTFCEIPESEYKKMESLLYAIDKPPGHSQLLMLHVEKRVTLKAEIGLGTRLMIAIIFSHTITLLQISVTLTGAKHISKVTL